MSEEKTESGFFCERCNKIVQHLSVNTVKTTNPVTFKHYACRGDIVHKPDKYAEALATIEAMDRALHGIFELVKISEADKHPVNIEAIKWFLGGIYDIDGKHLTGMETIGGIDKA